MKKRNKHFLKEKEYIRLQKELSDNRDAQHNLGWVELPQPQFIGYVAKLEPRHDIQNRDDAWVFWYICQTFGTTHFARKIEYFDWNRKKKYSYYMPMNKPHIHSIGLGLYLDLPPQVQKYFKPDIFSNSWRTSYHCDIPNFYWEIVYEKEYKTKIKLIDEILQQEESEIESKLQSDFYWDSKWCKGAPKSFRKKLNRSQRAKSKSTLHKIWKGGYEDVEFEDNYRSARWLWW
jgi:hypothetical protein